MAEKSSRVTFAVVLDVTLDVLVPGFFANLQQYQFTQGLDAGAFRVRLEVGRIEATNVTEKAFPCVLQVVQRAAEQVSQETLTRWLREHNVTREQVTISVIPIENYPSHEWTHGLGSPDPSVLCPKCSRPMVLRQGGRGPFWGCTEYPACRGSRPAK